MPYKEHSNIQAKNIYYMYELEKCKLCFSALKMGHVFNINEASVSFCIHPFCPRVKRLNTDGGDTGSHLNVVLILELSIVPAKTLRNWN